MPSGAFNLPDFQFSARGTVTNPPSVGGTTPHSPIYELLTGGVKAPPTTCESAKALQSKILTTIAEVAICPDGYFIQAGDERYDRAAYVLALRELYDWLTPLCNAVDQFDAYGIISTRRTCG